MSNTYRIIHYFIAFVGHTVEMPIYKDASDVIRRKNAITIYTNIKKQKDDLEKGLIQKVLYQGGCDSTGTFILTQMKNGSIYSSDMEIEVIAAQQAYSRQIEATRIEAARIEAERLESESIEAKRLESERIEAARIESERIEAQNTQPPITQEPLKQIKVLILGDITIGLKAIQIKTELMAEYTKVKADICILGTTYDGSHVYEYDRVYYYPTPTHTGAPSLQQNIDSYVKNGGIILSV